MSKNMVDFVTYSIEKLHVKETNSANYNQEADYYFLYNESVHPVLKYLEPHSISFIEDGGFSFVEENDNVIAETELCIESERLYFTFTVKIAKRLCFQLIIQSCLLMNTSLLNLKS